MNDHVKPVEAEIEGDRYTWWYVCGECHGEIDYKEQPCRHCGTPVIWPELPRKEKRNDEG